MVIGYSFQDNVILNKSPEFVGITNYVEILVDPRFWKATGNTVLCTVTSVAAHLVLAFAMMLDSPLLGRFSRSLFRALYVLPWLFTVAVIAVLWRMLLAPNGVVNFLLNTDIEWLASPQLRPIIVSLVLLDLIWTSQQFALIWMTTGGGPIDVTEVLSTLTYKLAFAKYDFSSRCIVAPRRLLWFPAWGGNCRGRL